MKHHRKIPIAVVVCACCLVFITTPAYAYIDPNAAGLASQIMTPLLIAAAVAVTFLRKQIGAAFGALSRRLRRRTDAYVQGVDFRTTVASLWFRLITLGIVGLSFAEALKLAQGEAQGWTFYLTTAEVVFEVVVRLVFAALAGIVSGTLCTAAIAPFLWHFEVIARTNCRVGDKGWQSFWSSSWIPGSR